MSRQEIKIDLDWLDLDGCTLDEAIAELTEAKSRLKPEMIRHAIKIESYDGGDFSERLIAYRLETDEEMESREIQEKAKDAEEFKRLKAKLGV